MAHLTLQQAFDLACQHHQAGRLAEAEKLYRLILAQQPDHVDATGNLGLIAHQVGRNDIAVELIRRAIGLRPNFPEAYNNLGNALINAERFEEAIAACRQAIVQRPGYAEAYSNLGNALRGRGLLDEAIAALREAIGLNPRFAQAYYNLGNVLSDKRQFDEAIGAFRKAIAIQPNYVEAHNNLGRALVNNGQLDKALATFRNVIALKPGIAESYINLGNTFFDKGEHDEAIAAFRQALALNPNLSEAHSDIILDLLYHPAGDSKLIAEEQRRWNRQHAEPLQKFIPRHANDRNPDRRLRIGYVSPDFRDHVVGRNVLPLLEHHDRDSFEIVCYANVLKPDGMTPRFQQLADGWRMIGGLSDEQAVKQILEDKIDILVDLTLHTASNRLLIFARKPAPVQVTFAGYPGTTGLTAIDYRLSDPYLDPVGMDESIYSEKTIRLPDSFWCYDPLENKDIAVNALPASEKGFCTFGCLNNFAKVNEGTLAVWAMALGQVENSRLLLMAPEGDHRRRVMEFLSSRKIDPARIEFLGQQLRRDYLKLYHRIDLSLDTFPYNGHTTSLDSFWMGVPVVTLVGQSAVSRAGWCQLSNLGLGELAAHSAEEFSRIAVGLVKDVPRLETLRSTLRGRMEQSPLMDGPGFARNIEAAYRSMWRTWCGEASRY